MPYETGGAPRNPFEAAKWRNVCFGQGETEPWSNVNEDVLTSTNTRQHQLMPMATLCNQPMCESEKETEVSGLADKLPSPLNLKLSRQAQSTTKPWIVEPPQTRSKMLAWMYHQWK